MISGTNCYWNCWGALDCGMVMAGHAFREPSFNPDICGLWIHLHSRPIFIFTLYWLIYIYTHTHISLILQMSAEIWPERVRTPWSRLARIHVGTTARPAKMLTVRIWWETKFFLLFSSCWYNIYLPLLTITGQCWACAERWCHWIASRLSLLCNQSRCNIQVWLYCPKCVCVCARVLLHFLCISFTDHSLCVWL